MFPREFLSKLEQWTDSEDRKPLVVRGASQVGKTMTVKMFGQRFERFIYKVSKYFSNGLINNASTHRLS